MRTSLFLGASMLLLTTFGGRAEPATGRPEDLAGTWALSLDKGGLSCRLMLQPQKSDRGDFFLGMPPACRHSMPALAAIGRWSMPDTQHLALSGPDGTTVLLFAADDEGYAATSKDGRYALRMIAQLGRSAAAILPLDAPPLEANGFAPVELVATRHKKADAAEEIATAPESAGRYAVMRDKRDTGCMLTLDTSRVAGGERAQLAPGCRDQGIVVFDPMAWAIVKGELVLTARAGHKARLAKDGEGSWAKDPKEGGKPLGLKKL